MKQEDKYENRMKNGDLEKQEDIEESQFCGHISE